ncbi:MAG TPA: DMT family transporter [Casimicrobiaceae bacterium]|jgi:drug/metabolite transporter (DMT)-like permease
MSARDLARLLALASLWGGSFAFIRIAVPALGPTWLAWSRVTLAFGALFALALVRGNVPSLSAHWRGYLVTGIVNSALPFLLFSFAEQYVTASTAAILNATSPFFGALAGAIWLGETLGARRLLGMGLGLAGVVLLVGWQPEPLSTPMLVAIFACLAAALCYGLASVYIKARMSGVPSFAVALYSQLGAAIVLAPALPFAALPAAPTSLVAANVLALALASTAIAYLLYFRLIVDIGPARALTVTFLIPLFGVLWGALFLGETPAANSMLGCALILAGTWLAVRTPGPPATVRMTDQGSA